MGVVSMSEVAQKLRFGGDRVAPGESKFIPLARIDVPADGSGDPRYQKLQAIAEHVSSAWRPADVVADVLLSVTKERGAWAATNTRNLLREMIEAGLLTDRRNDQGDAEVRRNPDPPKPLSLGEMLERQVAAQAAAERDLVTKERDARERIGREQAELVLAADRQTITDAMAPTIGRLESTIADLRDEVKHLHGETHQPSTSDGGEAAAAVG